MLCLLPTRPDLSLLEPNISQISQPVKFLISSLPTPKSDFQYRLTSHICGAYKSRFPVQTSVSFVWGLRWNLQSDITYATLELYLTKQALAANRLILSCVLLCVVLQECPTYTSVAWSERWTFCLGARGVLANLLFSFFSPGIKRLGGSLQFGLTCKLHCCVSTVI